MAGLCGQLFLQDTGIVDLRNVSERRCFISIGRPLDEIVQIKIESSFLNCRHSEWPVKTALCHARLRRKNSVYLCACLEENLALYERKSLRQFCEKMAGKTLTSRSNVLLVRQSRLTHGNGVLFSYQSKKNMKKSHHQGRSENDVLLWFLRHYPTKTN